MAWDSSNTSFELGISSSVFNVIRFAIMAVVLASTSQFLLDWLLSETRIRGLANGRNVHLSAGPSFRFLRTSSSGVNRKWLHLVLVLIIYASEVAIEFGSGSTTTNVLVYEPRSALQRTALQDVPQCFSTGQGPCFSIIAVEKHIFKCTEMMDLGLEWKYTAKRTEIVQNSSRLELVCPLDTVRSISATVLMYASERRENLTKGFLYREVHRLGPSIGRVIMPGKSGPRESLVQARMTAFGTMPAFPSMTVSNKSHHALLFFMDVILAASNASARIICDSNCLRKSRCSYLSICFMISPNRSDVLLHGAMLRVGNYVLRTSKKSLQSRKIDTFPVNSSTNLVQFLPADTMEMRGIAYSDYPSLIRGRLQAPKDEQY